MISLNSWIQTSMGTPIALHASHPMDDKRLIGCVLLIGGVHGDEPLGVELAQKTYTWLHSATAVTPWIVVPCLNIDGFNKLSRTNARGVDLNRNYPARNWDTQCTSARYHPGPHPGSECEVQGIAHLIRSYLPRLIIHCHSWKPCLVRTGNEGQSAAQFLAQASGYEIVDDIGYQTPGSLSQFGYHDCGIPVICIEESDDAQPGTTWNRFGPGIQRIFSSEHSHV